MRENIKSVRRRKYIYSIVPYLLKKRSVYKWSCIVQTRVVQGSTVILLLSQRESMHVPKDD